MSQYGAYVPDVKGIGKILKSVEVRAAVEVLAAGIAANIDEKYPTEMGHFTTDRAMTTITVKSMYSLSDEAKLGTLTKAAAAAGCEVKAKKHG